MQLFYTVRLGDTLSAISNRLKIPVETLAASSNLANPNVLYPGQQLSIPLTAQIITVQPGDTLYRISQIYGVPAQLIIEANQLKPPYTIYVEQALRVPPGVPYYVVQPGDTLSAIAARYNVITDGQNRYDLIQKVNQLSSDAIVPGMHLAIPYAPPGGSGKIAYVTRQGAVYSIRQYDPKSGADSPIAEGIAAASTIPYWSPDSKNIAFVGQDNILFIVNAASRQVKRIDQIDPYSYITWSPDSIRVAYPKGNAIMVYNVVNDQSFSIAQPGVTDVNWFPDGNRLLFQAPDLSGFSQLYSIHIDGSNRTQITHNQSGPLHYVRLSPDGRFAFYTTPGVSISIIYTIDLRSGTLYQVPSGPQGKDYFPTWAPDSSMLAYASTNYDFTYYSLIRVSGRQAESNRALAKSSCYATPVSWSPDSKKVAYLSGCDNNEFFREMWVVDQNHPAPVLAIAGSEMYNLAWSSKS